jgi:hypothetical protein
MMGGQVTLADLRSITDAPPRNAAAMLFVILELPPIVPLPLT